MRSMVFECLDNFLCFSLSSRTSHYENTQCYFSVGLPWTVCAFVSLTLNNILQRYVPRNTVAKWSKSLDLTTIPEARRILLVVSHFNLSVLATETLSVSLCREIDNVFGAVRTCFDHVLSKFSGFSWERILFLKSACVNMVMQIQVQIGDTRRVFYGSAWECWGFKKTTFCVRSRRHVLWILVYFTKTMKENMYCWITFAWQTFASLRLFTCLVYVSTYYVPIALLRQNKPFPLLNLGHAQITIAKMIRLKILLKLSKKASYPFFTLRTMFHLLLLLVLIIWAWPR